MTNLTDPDYLARQYGDATNLQARVRIHQRYSVNRYGWQRWLFDRLALPTEARILDVGCGSGQLWYENLARIPTGWVPVLADLSPGMLTAARRNLAKSPRHFPLANIDVQNLPFPDGYFDGVLALHMLYHVPDRQRALREILRVLRPGGRLYASTVGEQHMRELSRSWLAWRFKLDLGADQAGEAGQSGVPVGPASFSLENGDEQLAYLFANVRLFLYEDHLEVDDAAALIDYVNSMERLDEGAADRLRQALEQEIEANGPMRIGKYSGVFEAVKPA